MKSNNMIQIKRILIQHRLQKILLSLLLRSMKIISQDKIKKRTQIDLIIINLLKTLEKELLDPSTWQLIKQGIIKRLL